MLTIFPFLCYALRFSVTGLGMRHDICAIACQPVCVCMVHHAVCFYVDERQEDMLRMECGEGAIARGVGAGYVSVFHVRSFRPLVFFCFFFLLDE